MEPDIVYSLPIIGMKRYCGIKVVMIKELDKINNFLECIQYNDLKRLKELYGMNTLEKSNGVELIQINNSITQEGEVVALATVGIVLFIDISNNTIKIYNR